jgi:hypothetical protein
VIRTNRIVLAVAALLTVTAVLAVAQDADNGIVGIENGINFGYSLNTSDIGSGQELGIHLTVADNTQAGFSVIQGDATNYPSFSLMKLQYFLGPRVGITVVVGKTGPVAAVPPLPNLATGVGMFFNVFRRDFADSITTVLKLKMEYLVDVSLGIDQGLVSVGIAGKIGL